MIDTLEPTKTRRLETQHFAIDGEGKVYTMTLRKGVETDEKFNREIGKIEEVVEISIRVDSVVFILNPTTTVEVLINVAKIVEDLAARQR